MGKSIKRAWGLPITSSSDRLDQLGKHHNIDENVQAQVSREWVSQSPFIKDRLAAPEGAGRDSAEWSTSRIQ